MQTLLTPLLTNRAGELFVRQWMDGGHTGWGWGGWLWMTLMMALFWVLVAVAIVWIVRATRDDRAQLPPHTPSPLDVARERYARGELSDEEFERIKRGLSS